MDINEERLDFATKAVKRIIEAGGYPRACSTMDRAKALEGADGVLCTSCRAGHGVPWRHRDPEEVRVDINCGDTRGPRASFRAPNAARDAGHLPGHRALLPRATLLNYTNPMAMLCGACRLYPGEGVGPVPQRAGNARMLPGGSGRTTRTSPTPARASITRPGTLYRWRARTRIP